MWSGNVIPEGRCFHLVGGTIATCSCALNDLELIVCLKVEIAIDYSIKWLLSLVFYYWKLIAAMAEVISTAGDKSIVFSSVIQPLR